MTTSLSTFCLVLLSIFIYSPMYSTGLKTLPAITRTMQSRQFARISPFESFMRMKEKLFLSKGFAGSIEEKDPGKVIGTSYTIVKYPDPRLRAPNEDVTIFDDKLKQLSKEMLMIMYAADGVGLAAPQIGVNKRLMVFNEEGEEDYGDEMVLANPKIVKASEVLKLGAEGCLSFPKIRGRVERHEWIEVEYQNLAGETVHHRFTGLSSVIFQHEYDHLDKVLFVDRFIDEDKVKSKSQLDKLIKKYGPGGAV